MSTLINDTTFQLTDTGIVINDDTLPGVPFIDIETVSGLDSAPFRQTKRDHEGVDGGFMDAEFETGRDIALVGVLYTNGNPMETFLDSLKANWAPSTVLLPLYIFTVETGLRVVFVKPLGVAYDWDALRRTGMAAVTFTAYAEDPRIYSGTLQTAFLPLGATVFSGFAFPLAFPFSFGGVSTTTDGQFVYNVGNRPAPVVMTIAGPVTNPIIMNDTTSSIMTFNITLSSLDTLTIDTQYHTVRLNGNINRRSTLITPGWFMLQPAPAAALGANFLRFRAAGGTGTLTVTYRASWR
jgi:hypothetical protein